MYQNVTASFMAAQIEQRLIANKANEHWRREVAADARPARSGPIARLRALFARAGTSDQASAPVAPVAPAIAVSRERRAAGASG